MFHNTDSEEILFTTKRKQKRKQVVDVDDNETREETKSDSNKKDAKILRKQ